MLQMGSKGQEVKELQEKLITRGYSVGSYGADGDFGQGTYNAVIKFQSDKGLSVDGIVGPATWEALNGNDNNYVPNVDGSSNVAKFLKVAISQIGYKETPINITKYGRWYGMQDEWCAIFISWCANQAGILTSVVPRFHYCATGASWYRNVGRYRTRTSNYTPKPGDVIFFFNPLKPHPYYHVGIVEYTSGGRVHTVEGNTSDQVARRSYSLNDVNIHGYGTNGGTTINSNYENLLKEAGNKGLFAGTNTNFSGYNIETPMNILSMIPLITVRGKVTLRKTVEFGKVITLTSDAPKDLAASITNGIYSSGLTFDFTQENIRKTIQGINASIAVGSSLTYKIEKLPGAIVEATIEYKLPVTSGSGNEKNEVYQSIIIRIEQNLFMPVKLPVVATANQESLVDKKRSINVAEAAQSLLGFLILAGGAVIIISSAPQLASIMAMYLYAPKLIG